MSLYEERKRLNDRAWTLIDIDRPAEAIPLFLKALEFSPDDCYLFCGLASAFFHLKDWQKALEYADRAVQADPEEEWGHRWRSYCLRSLGRNREALDAAEEAVTLDIENDDCLSQLVNMQLACGRVSEAEQTASELLELAPDTANAYICMGLVYSEQNRLLEAEECNRKALELDPHSAAALNNLGSALWRKGNKQEAMHYYHEALRSNPTDEVARGNLEYDVREFGFDSIEEYLKAKHNPALMSRARRLVTFKEEAREWFAQGQPERAVPAIYQALRIAPDDVWLLEMLATVYMTRGDMRMALQQAERMVSVAPTSPLGYWRRGLIHLELCDADRANRERLLSTALHDAEAAVRLAPEDTDYHYLLVRAQCACGLLEEAEQTAKRLITLAPEWGKAYKAMGDVCQKQQHRRVAELFYQKAEEFAQNDADILAEMGHTYREIGSLEAAKRCFERASLLEPDNLVHRINLQRTRLRAFLKFW